MKILLLTNKLNLGGAETHIVELALALKRENIDVTVGSSGGIYELILKKNNIRHITLPLDRKDLSCIIESYIELKKDILKEKYDIVHAHARIPAFICMQLRKKIDFHFVTTCHYNFKNKGYTKRYTHWGECVFSISEDIDNYLIQTYNVQKNNIFRVVNGIDTNKFAKNEPIKEIIDKYKLDGKTVVYTTARLDEGSSEFITNCIKAIIALHEKYPNIVYLVSGAGELLSSFNSLAENINKMYSSPLVIFTGAVFNVWDYLNISSLFIGPSRSALEAISSCVPTIVSGAQGHIGIFNQDKVDECIETNFCSRKNNLADENVYIKDIDTILSMKKDDLDKIVKFGREFVCDNYSVDIMKKQYLAGYKKISSINYESNAVICGYYGNDNIGDELLLENIVCGLREKRGDLQFSVITSSKTKTKNDNNVNVIRKYDIVKIKKELIKTKTLIFGGGNIFQDKTSNRSLRYYAYIFKIAKENGCKVLIIGNGIGPISNNKNIQIVEQIIRDSDYISLRDKTSFEYVKSIKNENVFLTEDYVIGQKCENNTKILPKNEHYCVIIPKNNVIDINKLSSEINDIKEKYNINCVLLPFHLKEDSNISRMIAKKTNSIFANIKNEYELADIIKNSDFVISMRLHGGVIASNYNIPFMFIYDDRKLLEFAKNTYSEEQCKALCIENVEFKDEGILNNVSYMIENESDIQNKLKNDYETRNSTIDVDFSRIIDCIE